MPDGTMCAPHPLPSMNPLGVGGAALVKGMRRQWKWLKGHVTFQ